MAVAGGFAEAVEAEIDIFATWPIEAEVEVINATPALEEGIVDSVFEPKFELPCKVWVELLFN